MFSTNRIVVSALDLKKYLPTSEETGLDEVVTKEANIVVRNILSEVQRKGTGTKRNTLILHNRREPRE